MSSRPEVDPDQSDLAAARRHDERAFHRVVGPHRPALQAHCYRMLGSAQDAEDALQEALLRAWRGLPAFEGRSSLRSWLYRIATNVCLRQLERRPARVLPIDFGRPADPRAGLQPPLSESVWLDPYPDDRLHDARFSPEARYDERESVELAFVAAVQHLPARQRAVLLLRDVLGFAPAEIATMLGTSPAAVSSALQRAHVAVDERLPERSQQATLRSLGDARVRELVTRFMRAWEDGDVAALSALLSADARLAMPPVPTWFRGRDVITAFLRSMPLADGRRWRLVPVGANGQLAFGGYRSRRPGAPFVAKAIELVTLTDTGAVAALDTFHAPALFPRFGLPSVLPDGSGGAGGSPLA